MIERLEMFIGASDMVAIDFLRYIVFSCGRKDIQENSGKIWSSKEECHTLGKDGSN